MPVEITELSFSEMMSTNWYVQLYRSIPRLKEYPFGITLRQFEICKCKKYDCKKFHFIMKWTKICVHDYIHKYNEIGSGCLYGNMCDKIHINNREIVWSEFEIGRVIYNELLHHRAQTAELKREKTDRLYNKYLRMKTMRINKKNDKMLIETKSSIERLKLIKAINIEIKNNITISKMKYGILITNVDAIDQEHIIKIIDSIVDVELIISSI